MKHPVFFLLLFSVLRVSAQDYNVKSIPDSLLRNAHAVKRMEELRVTITAIGKYTVKHKYAITILDEQGADYAEYSNSYNSLHDLSNIDGTLYDADGKKLKSVKRKDIEDLPVTDGFSLTLDDRIKKHNFYYRQYPYTIEYEDGEESRETYFLPSWRPVEDENFSVQQSRFTVEIPAGYQLRYKLYHDVPAPVISGMPAQTYQWEMLNRKAMTGEPFETALNERLPAVLIGPTSFSMGGYTGDMRSWQSLGKFNALLNQNRDQLPDKIKQDIHQLVDGISNTEEKIDRIYHYLQSNTRYISIQLGIGGWQPFDAKYVAEKKYGDCKALSNYMVSLLKEAGIKANYVLVTAGKGKTNSLDEEFPAPYFNHVICCVPNGKDTIWLECTSQTVPPGYMGSFTGDRKALLIDEDGGHVVKTPEYRAEDNRQTRTIHATIDAEGNLTANVNTHFTGMRQELQHELIHEATNEQRQQYLNKALNLSTYEVDSSSYKEIPGRIPVIDEYLHIKAPNYATVSGRRMFIVPNLFNRSATKLSDNSERKTPIQFSQAFWDIDTVYLSVPAGYTVEAKPKELNLETAFGKFTASYSIQNNIITMIRAQVRNRKTLPASEYPALVKYFDAIYKADAGRIVLVKNE